MSYISDLNENDELSNIKAKRRKSQMESLKKRISTQFNESKTFIENYQLNLEFNLNLSIFADKKTVELKNSDKITIDLNNLKSFAHLLEADNHRIKGRIVYLQNDYSKIARNLTDFERTSHESLSLSKNFSVKKYK